MRAKLSVAFLGLLLLSSFIMSAESNEDEDEDEDEWDDESDSKEYSNYPIRPEVDDEGKIYKNPRNSPSAHCPRDEEQAEIIGQKCLRKCSADEDCKSKKKKCRCDGYCGMSCIKPDRECPELPEIKNGVMVLTGRLFGDKANYTCDSGYNVTGLSNRTCRGDGRWSGSDPTCKSDPKTYCSEPHKLLNAKHNALPEQKTFDLDSTVEYFCNHGYNTKGSSKAKCLMIEGAASWYGPDIVCEPRDCGQPVDIANGWHAGECYKFDCAVSYHCADGYELVGRGDKFCTQDGSWLPKEMPECVQVISVQCEPPDNPVNGKAIYTSTAYNSVVSYECKTGFTTIGDTTRRCGADKKWSGHAPTCREIDCGSPGILYNGWIDNNDNGTGMGASIIFRCKEHMKLEGHSSSLCQMDGKWSYPMPLCLAPCVVPHIARGHVHVVSDDPNHINNVTIAEHGKRLDVECEKDYEFDSNNSPVICNNGTWSVMPSCSPARCKQMPKPPKNGMVIAPKTDHGMKAVFKCKDGFEQIGGGPYNDSYAVYCQFGNWTGDIPHCVEVFCPYPGNVENGKVFLIGNMGVYDYRPYVKKVINNKQILYECIKGYIFSSGPPGATCVGGTWRPKELPKCILAQHPSIRPSRRRRSVQEDSTVIAYRKFIDFFRKIGQKLLELEMEKSHEVMSRKLNHTIVSNNNNTNITQISNSTKIHYLRIRDEKMIEFLKGIYKRLQRIDTRHSNNDTNITMHELLNEMSKNFFNVDLSENRKNTTKNHNSFEVKNQREFIKLKREFERILKFYNKSLRWSEKHLRKDLRKKKKSSNHSNNFNNNNNNNKTKERKHKSQNYYKGFYEFINDYVSHKLSSLEAENATEELINKLKIEKLNARNGTMYTVGEIYTFFRHIIEEKINSSKTENETVITQRPPLVSSENSLKKINNSKVNLLKQTTKLITTNTTTTKIQSTTTKIPILKSESDNDIPEIKIENDKPKLRNKRVRNVVTKSPNSSDNKRKLLSIEHPLDGDESSSNIQNERNSILFDISNSPIMNINSDEEKRAKRKVSISELHDNQNFLKGLYVNQFENEYSENVKDFNSDENSENFNRYKRQIKLSKSNIPE